MGADEEGAGSAVGDSNKPRSVAGVISFLLAGVVAIVVGLILLLLFPRDICQTVTTSGPDGALIQQVQTCSEAWWRNPASALLVIGALISAPGFLHYLLAPGDKITRDGLEKGLAATLTSANDRLKTTTDDAIANAVFEEPPDADEPPKGVGLP